MPSIVAVLDKNFDVSICLDLNEEESKNGETEAENKLELKFFEFNQNLSFTPLVKANRKHFLLHDNYNLLHHEDHSPPPEHII